MAKSINVLLKFLGDATSATGAVSKLGGTVDRLGERLRNAATQATSLNQKIQQMSMASMSSMNALGSTSAKAFGSFNLGGLVSQAQKFLVPIQAATGLMGRLGSAALTTVSTFSRMGTQITSFFTNAINSGVQRATRALEVLRQNLLNINDLFRYVGHGITNLGRALMFAVSLPMGAFFASMTKEAVNFEDALVRVGKTTGLAGNEMVIFREKLRELARNTATSHVELAGIAEVIGQMGVKSKEAIFNLTQIFDMYANATDQTGEDVANHLGKIANAYGKSLGESSEWVMSLASSMNFLENETASTAQQIQNVVSDFAPFAQFLKMSAQDAIGFGSTLIALGMSADEAGTALRNMTYKVADNADHVVELMGHIKDQYSTTEGVVEALGENATQVFIDIARAAGNTENSVEAFIELMELGGIRGGRALATLMTNVDLLEENLRRAGKGWEDHIILITEYERAMESTKSQMQLLRNNINDVGITLGDTLLPVVNTIIQVLVPALQMASDWFKSLGKDTQLWIIAIAGFVIVAGPLLFILGQMVSGLAMIVLGFGQVARVGIMIISSLGGIATAMTGLAGVFFSWPVIALAAVTGVLKILSKLGVDVAGFFQDLGQRALDWGENLAANLASGILAGAARYITMAINWIANLIASFFESHSPPKDGPLATINKWGIGLMKSFLQGFKNADFSILSDIGRIVERELTRGVEDKALPGALKAVANFRQELSRLIAGFNESGKINMDLLHDITSNLGPIKDEVRELVKTWMEYNKIQERIAEIEARRKAVKKEYYEGLAEIGQSELTIAEKVAAIREAQRKRDDNLRGLTKEQEQLEEQSAEMKAQMEYQKNMIDAVQKQEDLFARIEEAIKRLADAIKKMAGTPVVPAEGLGGLGEMGVPEEAYAEAMQKFNDIKDRFSEGRAALQGFIDAWNGLDPSPPEGLTEKGREMYNTLYNMGEKAAEIRDKFLNIWTNVTVFAAEAKIALEEIKTLFAETELPELNFEKLTKGFTDFSNKIKKKVEDVKKSLEPITNVFESIGELLGPKLGPIWDALVTAWESIKQAFAEAWAVLEPSLGPIINMFKEMADVVQDLAVGQLTIFLGAIVGVISGILTALPSLITGLGAFVSAVIRVIASGLALFGESFAFWKELFSGNWDAAMEHWKTGFEAAKTYVANIWNSIVILIGTAFSTIMGFISGFVEGVIAFFRSLYEQLIGGSIIPDMLAAISMAFVTWIAETLAGISQWVLDMVAKAVDVKNKITAEIGALVTSVIQFYADLVVATLEKFIEIAAIILENMLQAKQNIIGTITQAQEWLIEQWGKFKTIGADLVGGLIAGIKSKVEEVISAVTSLINKAIDTAKGLLKTDSPSKVFKGFGLSIGDGLSGGIASSESEVIRAMKHMINNLMNAAEMSGITFGGVRFADAGIPSQSFLSSSGIGILEPVPAPAFSDFSGRNKEITININDPIIREEEDLERIIEAVKVALGKDAGARLRFGGQLR